MNWPEDRKRRFEDQPPPPIQVDGWVVKLLWAVVLVILKVDRLLWTNK